MARPYEIAKLRGGYKGRDGAETARAGPFQGCCRKLRGNPGALPLFVL